VAGLAANQAAFWMVFLIDRRGGQKTR
jgi:hypothetical protein